MLQVCDDWGHNQSLCDVSSVFWIFALLALVSAMARHTLKFETAGKYLESFFMEKDLDSRICFSPS